MGQNLAERHRPIIIEFLGAPGSGKSTLSHRVAEVLRTMGMQVKEPSYELDHQKNTFIRKHSKLYKAVKHMLHRPIYSLRSIVQIVRSDQRHWSEMVKLVINMLYISEYYRECVRERGVYIFDQGFFQILCSTLYSAKNKTVLDSNQFYTIIQDSIEQCRCIVISVDADKATVILRMQQRGGNASRLEQITSKPELSNHIRKFYRCLLQTEKIIHDWSKKKKQGDSEFLSMMKIKNGKGSSITHNENLVIRSIQRIVNG